jgi:hypothetical protein
MKRQAQTCRSFAPPHLSTSLANKRIGHGRKLTVGRSRLARRADRLAAYARDASGEDERRMANIQVKPKF